MTKKRFTPEQIIHKLREAEVLISQGLKTPEAARKVGIVEQTYYRWRKAAYGGMRTSQAKRLKVLATQNVRLKRLVADKELNIQILKETLNLESKNY